uniref:Cystinosin homolog n=1 Tax=Parascaris univalens TaxID=6257 RepID=A0A915BHD3_PARUN
FGRAYCLLDGCNRIAQRLSLMMVFIHLWIVLSIVFTTKTLASDEVIVSDPDDILIIQPSEISLTIGEEKAVQFTARGSLSADVELTLNKEEAYNSTPQTFILEAERRSANVTVTGLKISSFSILEVRECHYINSSSECPFSNLNRTFAEIRVIRSNTLSVFVVIVGWIYFVAWSVSFYPQIYLNFRRRSVVGLNFDFLLLNVIGFTCYTFYNVLMYFDSNIQDIYEETHPHSHIPVLLNDVVFAVHALFACIVTALQCFFYQRGGQRVSYVCATISSAFILFAVVSFVLTMVNVINALQFITFLSYIKMGATLCKYFPQAFFNFKRKSTVGWSIGNVLLDFLGGSMDICQMILQGANTDDWSAFYGNPVKFGLGLVSMLFDIVFMIQHYVLYRHAEGVVPAPSSKDLQRRDSGDQCSDDTAASDDGSNVPIYVDRSNNPVV